MVLLEGGYGVGEEYTRILQNESCDAIKLLLVKFSVISEVLCRHIVERVDFDQVPESLTTVLIAIRNSVGSNADRSKLKSNARTFCRSSTVPSAKGRK